MAFSRYGDRRSFVNAKDLYSKLFEARDVRFIRQYASPNMRYPTESEINSLSVQERKWKRGDRLSKIAEASYGDPKLWWVIAWFNKKPTEGHFSIGESVYIPFPLERVLDFMGV
jgi:nucleoid-associated protein YgaU